MWGNSTEFGGAGGGGGGGFVPSQGGNSVFDTSGSKGRGSRKTQNLMPVCAKQVIECQEDSITIEEVEANMLTIVGLVTGVVQSTTKVTIYLYDQTATVECMLYVGTDEGGSADIPFIPAEGTYGRVIGALRTMKGSKYLVMFRFLPVTDLNEMTCHHLEVTQTPMKLKKLREAEAQKTGVGLDNTLSNSMIANNFGNTTTPGMIPSTGGGGGNSTQRKGFNPVQAQLLNIIQSNRSDEGVHKDVIINALGSKVSLREIEKMLDDFSSEGLIFSTVDDDHYRSTD